MTFSRLASTGVLLAAVMGGCGGGTPQEGGKTAATPASARDACALVDLEELGAIAGATLSSELNVDGSNETSCELRAESGGEPLVFVTVQWTGGREQAQAQRGGMAIAARLMNEPGIDIEELTGSGTEPGLADDAYYSDLLPSWVLTGDVLIEVISPMFEGDRTRRTFLAVAKTAIARL